MADFRKWVLALTVMALFAGLAAAQGSSSPFVCNVTSSPPQMRSEGLTELTGDILLSCSGGPNPASLAGQTIPTANVTVYMNGTVTSRLLGTASVSGASEALLLIDDPGAQVPSYYGQTVPQTPCLLGGTPTPLFGAGPNGCLQSVGATAPTPTTFAGLSATSNLAVPVNGTGGTAGTPGANVFQGVVSGSSVTFFGIPILAPGTTGTRTYRITNIRVNASGISGGGPVGTSAIAAVAISPAVSGMQVNNSTLTVGFISPSLSTSANKTFSSSALGSSGTSFNQCNSQPGSGSTPVAAATLRFQEQQAQAFRMRGNTAQTTPGFFYYTESGFTPTFGNYNSTPSFGSAAMPGLADWGTRLKAVFNNVPSGVSLYVTVNNLASSLNAPMPAPTTSVFNSSYASLIVSETSPDSGYNPATPNGPPVLNSVPAVSPTGNAGTSSTAALPYAPLTVVNNSAVAVWEVVNSLQNANENFDFEVFITYSANAANNVPSLGSMTVNLSYAPTATQGAFSLSAGSAASSTLGIPRFADTSTAKNVLTINICQTALLFPYVTSAPGFDTGIAVANTTTDPFGTGAQAGYCSIYWYGSGAPTTSPAYLGAGNAYSTTVPTSANYIASGTVSAFDAYSVVQGFTGYMIAVCNFQFAHGFAFISDLGTRNFAMGYLADVINGNTTSNAGTGVRGGAPVGIEANGQ